MPSRVRGVLSLGFSPPDVARALQDRFSTSGSLGLGLPGVRRLMDDFLIDTEVGRGTRVRVRKWLP